MFPECSSADQLQHTTFNREVKGRRLFDCFVVLSDVTNTFVVLVGLQFFQSLRPISSARFCGDTEMTLNMKKSLHLHLSQIIWSLSSYPDIYIQWTRLYTLGATLHQFSQGLKLESSDLYHLDWGNLWKKASCWKGLNQKQKAKIQQQWLMHPRKSFYYQTGDVGKAESEVDLCHMT